MTKLNVLINKKTGEKQNKQQDTILMENDFIETLKEHEAKSISMQVSKEGVLLLSLLLIVLELKVRLTYIIDHAF